jgi:protein phosphatase
MGKCRDVNEDNCIHCKLNDNYDLLIVADGMGGHNAGEVASEIAVKSISGYIKCNIKEDTSNNEIIQIIKDAILKANLDIYTESINNSSCSGMGTTVTVGVLSEHIIWIGHVGDSRAYILGNNKLHKLTNDHSLVAELVKNGTITESEALHHPQKNIITRALGTGENVEIDIENISIDNNNIIMLCTDGLTNMVSDGEIEDILINSDDVAAAAQKLVGLANELGGYDNITVVIAKIAFADSEVGQ